MVSGRVMASDAGATAEVGCGNRSGRTIAKHGLFTKQMIVKVASPASPFRPLMFSENPAPSLRRCLPPRAGSTVLGGMCLVWRARLALRAVMPAAKIHKGKRSEPWTESVAGAVASFGLKQRKAGGVPR